MTTSVNPIAIRSKKWICDAFLELLQEKPYNNITITEICDKADLVRKTFYRHFNSKESVLVAVIDSMFEDFYNYIQTQNFGPDQMPLAYFTYWEKHKNFLSILIENQQFSLLNDQFVIYLEAMAHIVGSKRAYQSELEKEYMRTMLAGGLWSILKKWMTRDCSESPEEMARMTLNFFDIKK
ncbi:TetR/AcrR family transcriptional regulator [Paenibacillus endoradicis]|uniref:TetR/AcrR family transcriptional regulator n=1 Tax=Paenibacillus endoradicis TaxID=2972487 RepID=UPI002159229B|nr:TetR/AcrR family transcriptional regulator [Paenibacillus endoradicis]MCR8658655.1 TetR/AcrR family transcriptional regulator [Paenibacillus endoradicis]